jgi:hypothetical protein
MSTYIDENWYGIATGPTNNPDGWDLSFGNGIIYPYSSGGQYGNQFYQFNGGNFYSPYTLTLSAPYTVSLFWGWNVSQGSISAGGVVLLALNAAATGYIPILTVRSEVNNSLSVIGYPNTQVLYNTSNPADDLGQPCPTFIYEQGIWYYSQLNATFEVDPAGSGLVQVAYEFAINGATIASGTKLTGVIATDLFGIGVWLLQFPSALTGYLALSNITLQDRVSLGTYPHPPVPPITLNEDICQMVVEYAQKPGDSNVDITQMIIEAATMPSPFSSVDISQMVIEVAYLPGLSSTGWIVQEA